MGTQKNRLNETVLLGTQNKCLNRWVRKYSKFHAQKDLFLHTLLTYIDMFDSIFGEIKEQELFQVCEIFQFSYSVTGEG